MESLASPPDLPTMLALSPEACNDDFKKWSSCCDLGPTEPVLIDIRPAPEEKKKVVSNHEKYMENFKLFYDDYPLDEGNIISEQECQTSLFMNNDAEQILKAIRD
uniref:Rhodanese domain-containing protein n=1 Tax=Trichogramma kaykai TaxID=54128 RepID=A0ABD2WU40_9HYME